MLPALVLGLAPVVWQGHVLLGDEELLAVFREAYASAMKHLFHDPWCGAHPVPAHPKLACTLSLSPPL